MTPLRLSVRRLLRLLRIFVKYRLDRLTTLAPPLPLWLKILLLPVRLKMPPTSDLGRDLVDALIELGPAFIKLGQLLSTRRDLLPEHLADELATLQDQVPAFDCDVATTEIEQAIGQPITDCFQQFESLPLASASIAQVHAAELLDGRPVVIKLRRPKIEDQVKQDLDLLESIAAVVDRTFIDAKRLHLKEIIRDYQMIILGELNFIQEAANATRLRDLWLPRGKLYVPEVYSQFTRDNIIVMERVYGIGIGNRSQLVEAQVNLEKLANLGVEIFFTQVFTDNFFHADMHPGNILVDITDPYNPTYIALDCAIIGCLTRQDRAYLGRNLIGFFNQNYRDIAEAHVDSGWVPAHIDIDAFEAVIRKTCEPLFGKTMADIAFGALLIELFGAARQFEMEVQPQLVLLQKTLLNIEGIGRHLYGDLDLWQTAAPFMRAWRAKRLSPRALFKEFTELAPELLQELPDLPKNLLLAARRVEQLNQAQVTQAKAIYELKQNFHAARRGQRRQHGIILLAISLTTLLVSQTSAYETPLIVYAVLAGLLSYGLALLFTSKDSTHE